MFEFGFSGFLNPKTGRKLHIIKTLIDMRERSGVTNEDRDALMHAITYIKELEAEVRRLQPTIKVSDHVVVKVTPVTGESSTLRRLVALGSIMMGSQ